MVDEKGDTATIAAVIRMDLARYARFYDHQSDPLKWPSPIWSQPTAVYLHDNHAAVIYGGLAYSIGSQLGRSGWFIDQIAEDGMMLEHRGHEHMEGRWKTRWIPFKTPYLLPLAVGPEGFTKIVDLPIPPR